MKTLRQMGEQSGSGSITLATIGRRFGVGRPISLRALAREMEGTYEVRFKGIHCFGQQKGPGSDDAYVDITVYPIAKEPNFGKKSVKLPVDPPNQPNTTWKISSGESRKADDSIYSGSAADVGIHVILMEQDQADISETEKTIRDKVSQGVDEGLKVLYAQLPQAMVIEAIPGLKADIKALISNTLIDGVKELIGWENDNIGEEALLITLPEMIALSKVTKEEQFIRHSIATNLLTDGDASYKAYFEVRKI